MKISVTTTVGMLMFAAFAGVAGAHHSVSMYEQSTLLVLDGTVKTAQLTNPHVWFVITAAGSDGVVMDWNIQGPSPNSLTRRGWKRADVNVGDKVAFTIHPRKDGSASGIVVSVRLAGGRELLTGIGRELPQ